MVKKYPKIAIVHEYLVKKGGAERVLKTLLEIFPQADLFALIYDRQNAPIKRKVKTSYLQYFPKAKSKYQLYLALMPKAVESFDFSKYDIVISSSHSFAKGILKPARTLHICYCHTPTRWLWLDPKSHLKRSFFWNPIKKIIPLFYNYLKNWDLLASKRPDYYLANSKNVQKRIKKYYNRNSRVIYPAIDFGFWKPIKPKEDFFLYVSRLEPHKRPDLAVSAFNKLGLPLKIIGQGSLKENLKKIAHKNIKFLGQVSDLKLRELYSQSKALIFPQEEDFGLVPLEAQACGTPVIALQKGGAIETVINNYTGIFFKKSTPADLISAVKKFSLKNFNPLKIRLQARQFNLPIFKKKFKEFIDQKYQLWQTKIK